MSRLILCGVSRSGTTVTRNMMSEHPDIWLTNEGRLYWEVTQKGYFQRLYNKLIRNRKPHKPPGNLEKLKTLKMEGIKDRVEAAEEIIFDDRCRYFGDKGIRKEYAKVLIDNDLPFKIILIRRDGRDSVSSALRYNSTSWFGKGNVRDKSLVWAQLLKSKLEIIDEYGVEGIVLRFEDYADFPGKNMGKVESFLDVDGLVEVEKLKFKEAKSNIGSHKKWCPNWREEFHPEAINLLEELGYI